MGKGWFLTALAVLCGARVAAAQSAPDSGWPNYGNDGGGTRYSAAQQIDRSTFDPTAGLYQDNGRFDPDNPDPALKIGSASAYNHLRHGGSVYFHPPNGGFEQMQSLDDLQTYVYSKEARPPQ